LLSLLLLKPNNIEYGVNTTDTLSNTHYIYVPLFDIMNYT